MPTKPADGIADPDHVLTAEARQAIGEQLVAYAQDTHARYGVALFAKLGDDSLEDVSIRIAESWKIGSKKESDGVLLSIFLAEHKIRIEVGYGLEGKLPDAICARIMREQMAPRFRTGDIAGGITDALAKIDSIATGRAAIAAPVAAEPEVEPIAETPTRVQRTVYPEDPPPEATKWDAQTTVFVALLVTFGIAGAGALVYVVFVTDNRSGLGGSSSSSSFTMSGSGSSFDFGSSSASSSPSSSSESSTSSSWDSGSASGGSFGGGGASGSW